MQYGVPTPVDGNISIQHTICYIKRVDRCLLSTLGLIYGGTWIKHGAICRLELVNILHGDCMSIGTCTHSPTHYQRAIGALCQVLGVHKNLVGRKKKII